VLGFRRVGVLGPKSTELGDDRLTQSKQKEMRGGTIVWQSVCGIRLFFWRGGVPAPGVTAFRDPGVGLMIHRWGRFPRISSRGEQPAR